MDGVPAQDLLVPERLAGKRLDAVLAELSPGRSRAAWQKAVRRGQVRLDGRRVLRSNLRLQPGSRLQVPGQEAPVASQSPELVVLHEDDHILVLDKPAGLLTHGTERRPEPNLAQLAAERFGRLPLLMGEERPGIVHRLDRNTSGVIVLARTAAAMEELRGAFRERRVRKEYLALVHGRPEATGFECDEDLGPREGHPDKQECRPRGEGKTARTGVVLEEQLGELSLLRCRPHSGRRHQIRVHLSARGLPIVGDPMYRPKGTPALPSGAPRLRRHALHADSLCFRHPHDGEEVAFSAPLPGDLREVLDWFRARVGT